MPTPFAPPAVAVPGREGTSGASAANYTRPMAIAHTDDTHIHMSDDGLLALVARGDHDAFAAFYDRYGQAAYNLAARIVRDRHLAEDVVQEVFVAVHAAAGSFDSRRGRPAQWLLTMTHHKAVDLVRRRQVRRADSLPEGFDPVDPRVDVTEQAWVSMNRELIGEALATLPDTHRELIELAYFGGYTQHELADRLRVPIGTVKSRTFRALDLLRAALNTRGLDRMEQWNIPTT